MTPRAAASPTRGWAASGFHNAIARLPDPLGTTIIFDQAIWDGPPGRNHAQPPNPLIGRGRRHGAQRRHAGEAGRNARAVAGERLEDTVAEYNEALDAGALAKLAPPRRGDPVKAWPIRTAPFYALPICAAITNTMGGIVVDGDARVLDTNDKPIPGLYAAGSTVGGLDGGPHAGYVGGLIKATIGLRAAEDDRRIARRFLRTEQTIAAFLSWGDASLPLRPRRTPMNLSAQAAQSLSLSEGLKHAHELEQEAHQLMAKAQSDVVASKKALRQSRKILRHAEAEKRDA